MGDFTGDGGPPITQQDKEEIVQDVNLDSKEGEEPTGFSTDVSDVRSDDEIQLGTDKFPVFNVGKNEFYQNMNYGRKRLRFKSGTGAQQYMSKTNYKRPFYVSYTDSKGKQYKRRIK